MAQIQELLDFCKLFKVLLEVYVPTSPNVTTIRWGQALLVLLLFYQTQLTFYPGQNQLLPRIIYKLISIFAHGDAQR